MEHRTLKSIEDKLSQAPSPRETPRSGDPQSACYIFWLPREIRDLIYVEYVTVRGGYMYDPNHDQLVRAQDGAKIDISLMRTCHRIREEMQGLLLGQNKITFQASCSKGSSDRAGVLHATLHRIERAQWLKMCLIGPEFLTDDIKHRIKSEFPQFRQVVDGLKALGGQDIENQIVFNEYAWNTWGKAPSTYRDFLQQLFKLVSQHPGWTSRSQQCALKEGVDVDFVGPVPEPWSILNAQDVERIKDALYPEQDWQQTAFTTPSDTYITSAAALAINFLKSIPPTERKSAREIELVETHAAVAYPECHMRGFIPLCKENSQLRIRRFANVWKSVFPAISHRSSIQGQTHLGRGRITEHVAKWIVEAKALLALGMPKECFTLVLDGAPFPAKAAQVFDVILEDSTEQAAMDHCFARELIDDERWLERRAGIEGLVFLYYEEFPEAIRDLATSDKGNVRCNFVIDPKTGLEDTVQARVGWTWQKWQENLLRRWDEPGPPMPADEYLRNDQFLDNWQRRVDLRARD